MNDKTASVSLFTTDKSKVIYKSRVKSLLKDIAFFKFTCGLWTRKDFILIVDYNRTLRKQILKRVPGTGFPSVFLKSRGKAAIEVKENQSLTKYAKYFQVQQPSTKGAQPSMKACDNANTLTQLTISKKVWLTVKSNVVMIDLLAIVFAVCKTKNNITTEQLYCQMLFCKKKEKVISIGLYSVP